MKHKLMAAMVAVIGMTMPLIAADKVDDAFRQTDAADYAARFALHGRPAPENHAELQAESQKLLKRSKVANVSGGVGTSYPESAGGDKSYEYISSFTVTPKDGYYKIRVKVICPKLYDAEGYPGYGSELEYVNVWIDWNGDYSWSDSECVMAKSSANYKKILADNKILYFETTVKDASTAGGTFKARAMLGYGYNPTSPGTYSWTWGDVMDKSVSFSIEPPEVAAIAVGPYADVAAYVQSSPKGAVVGTNKEINGNNAVILGRENRISVGIKVKKSDREKPGFNYKAVIDIEGQRLGPFSLVDTPYDTAGEYGYYYLNGKVIFPTVKEEEIPTSPSSYGKKKLTVQLDCTDPGVDMCSVPQPYYYYVFYPAKCEKKVLQTFHVKNDTGGYSLKTDDVSMPMWFIMWREFIDELKQFEYHASIDGGNSLGDCVSTYTPKAYDKIDPAGTTKEGDVSWSFFYRISKAAWEKIQPAIPLSSKFTQSKVDYEIDEVYRTVKHELEHGNVKLDYNRYQAFKLNNEPGKEWVFAFFGDDEMKFEKSSSGKWKYIEGDLLSSKREKEIGSLDSLTDTFSISKKGGLADWSGYYSYGDQEYYVRWIADEKGSAKKQRASKYYSQDWSFPGSQLREEQLNVSPKANLGSKTKSKVLAMSSISSTEYSSRSLSESLASFVMNNGNQFQSGYAPEIVFLSTEDATGDFTTEGLSLETRIDHLMNGVHTLNAYLFGTNGIPVAMATTTMDFDNSTKVVRFEFPADIIGSAREYYEGPYVLGRISCRVINNPMAITYSEKDIFTTKDYSAYECKVTKPIVGSKMSDYADGEGLHVVIPVTVPSAGTYTFSAYLATTNGMNLVNATTNCVCAEGKNGINVCFSKDGVFNTKMSGRFLVRDVSVTPEGGEPSLFVCDYETKSYNYSDFDSGEKAIVILPKTIELSVSKDTEDPNALHKGIAMRFTVKNKSSSDYTLYRASAILVDANGYNVAYAEEDFIFNGESSNVLFFPAQDIRESGKNGPYSVKTLRITDRVTGELIDGCMVSAAKTASLASTEFKGEMTIDEDAISITPVAASSDKNKYAGFHLIVPIDSPSSGYATLSAIVESEGGASVGRFEDEIEVGSGANKLTLNLGGAKFLESKVNGPYVIRAISVSHSANPDAIVEAVKVLHTSKYEYTQFVDASIPAIIYYTVKFEKNASDATGSMAAQVFTKGEAKCLSANAFSRAGYTFAGWATSAGGEVVHADKSSFTVSEDTTLYAKWIRNTYMVAFDANGGSGTMAAQQFSHGVAQGLSRNVFVRKHYKFTGWATSPNGTVVYSDGQSINVTANATLYAVWEQDVRTLGGSSASANFSQALTFTAYTLSEDSGEISGLITIKTKKEKGGVAAATVTIQPVGGKKQTIKGTISTTDGMGQGTLAGLTFTAGGVTGTINGYSVDGAIDASKSKDAAMVAVLNAFKGKSYVMALEPEAATGGNAAMVNGIAGFSIVFSAKGKAKVTGTMPDGTKVSVSSQLIVGSEWCCLPVVYSKTGNSLAFLLWFDREGNFDSVSGMTAWKGKGFEVKWNEDVAVSKVGNLSGTSYFHLADTPAEIGGAEIIPELLPIDVAITTAGTKWNIVKAKAVKLDRSGNLSYGANPSGLKLTYAAKTGMFKGSLSLYTMNRGRLKKNSVSISGIVVNGVGYGTATLKKVGCWPIVINAEAAKAADFKARITGVAVVDERSYDETFASVTFVPPETALVVPYGKMAVFRTEYDFPAGYSTYVWVRESGPAAENLGSSGSYFNRGTGVAYNFIMFQEGAKACTLKSVRLEIMPQPEVAGADESWDVGTIAVNLTFMGKDSADKTELDQLKAQFKVSVTGVAVVNDFVSYYDDADVAAVTFLSPQTPLEVPYGASVLIRMSYDFPSGYAAQLWTCAAKWSAAPGGSSYNNPSLQHVGKGTAYGFIGLEGHSAACTLEAIRVDAGAYLTDDGKRTEWGLNITPVNITFSK